MIEFPGQARGPLSDGHIEITFFLSFLTGPTGSSEIHSCSSLTPCFDLFFFLLFRVSVFIQNGFQ